MEEFNQEFISKLPLIEDNEDDLLKFWDKKRDAVNFLYKQFYQTFAAVMDRKEGDFQNNLGKQFDIPVDIYISDISDSELRDDYETQKQYFPSFVDYKLYVNDMSEKLADTIKHILNDGCITFPEIPCNDQEFGAQESALLNAIYIAFQALRLLYNNIKHPRDIPLNIMMKLDLAFSKLLQIVTLQMCFFIKVGLKLDKEYVRTQEISKQLRKKEKRDIILTAYKQITKTNKTRHRVATDIYKQLKITEQTPPSIATIKRRLQEAALPPFDK